MKNITKLLSVIIIGMLLLCSIFANNSYAADDPIIACKVSTFLSPNNPSPGQELSIDISVSEIKVPIAGVGFTLNYEQNLFDFVSINSDNGWNKVDRADLTFMCYQESLESVTKEGKIATIKLKVKDNASATTTNVGLTGIQVALDNNQPLKIQDLSQKVTITTVEQKQNNNDNQNNNNNNNQNENNNQNNNNNNNQNENNNQNNNNNNQNNNNQGQYVPPEIDTNKIVTINGDNNNNNNSNNNSNNGTVSTNKSKDTTATSKNLPKTGKETTVLLVIALVAGTVFGIISFKKYKRI